MNLLEAMQKRHSIRKYEQEPIPEEKLNMVLQAGLLSASSRGRRPWELIVIQKRETLEKMSQCRAGAANMLSGAGAAIVVVADEKRTDVWIEDCSIVMANMHLMADSLGVGSCWIQGRLREAADGSTTEEYLGRLLGIPENYRLEAMLSLGVPAESKAVTALEELDMSKIHFEKF
ncbi:MAG: nitroreductase family protein [Anaerovoracaceae bacterium]|nr:nitroreductase family protein [Anaerovoracaceae bacterium]